MFLSKYMKQTVCRTKNPLSFLYYPFINMVNFSNLSIFLTTWSIYAIIVLVVWLTPCNVNINCDTVTNKKDFYKAMGSSLLIFIIFMILISLSAKLTIKHCF